MTMAHARRETRNAPDLHSKRSLAARLETVPAAPGIPVRWAANAGARDRDIRRHVSARYRGALRHYCRFKMLLDPVYVAVAAPLLEAGAPVLDIGSGVGLLGFYLSASGFGASYLGIDCDAGKVAAAHRIAGDHGLPLVFETRTAAELPDFSGAVVLLDVLHYLERAPQRTLLLDAAARVAPGGLLVMRTVLREPRWRYRATVCEEWLLHAFGWMQMPARHFPSRADIEDPLLELGLAVEIRPLWGTTPFASFLIIARRNAL